LSTSLTEILDVNLITTLSQYWF